MLDISSDNQSPTQPDVLSEVLQDLRLSGAAYCRREFKAPLGLEFPPEKRAAVIHFVAEGTVWLRATARDPLLLQPGDAGLLPHGVVHALVDDPERPAKRFQSADREQIGETTYRLRAGGSGARSLLVCCAVSFEEPSVHPLLELMPEALLVRGGGADDPALPGRLGGGGGGVKDAG